MPDRASVSLSEKVLAQAERGELGEAFRLVWDGSGQGEQELERVLLRAELQADCGNQDAALSLQGAMAPSAPGAVWIRAKVAAGHGDWDAAASMLSPRVVRAVGGRAALLLARAQLALGRGKETLETLESVEPRSALEALEARAVRACAEANVEALETLVLEARNHKAVRIEAEVWADLAILREARGDLEGARAAASQAVELWDGIATTLQPPLRAGFWLVSRRATTRTRSKRTQPGASLEPVDGLAELVAGVRRLASERDADTLLDVITDAAVSISGAERGFVLLVDESGSLEPRTIRNAEDQLGRQTAAFSRSIAETVLIDGEPVLTLDASADARVQDYMSVHQLMLKSVACLPIETRGRTWGVLYLEHRSASGRFSGDDLPLLRAFADQAAVALETAELLRNVERQRKDLERANAALREAKARLEAQVHGQAEALELTRREITRLQGSAARGERWGLVGASREMRAVYEVLERITVNEVPVVITGESGTGKELVARAIHRGGPRSDAPFVSLSCGAIPEGLLESELFGHVAGAFTGASRARDGVFVQADGGTLFLDEVADMPPRMQLDLLRVLQERRVRPVGAAEEVEVDVRVIAASKEPLQRLIAEGRLREDLYYRLAVIEVALPPLRSRRSDIPLLCDHFLERIAEDRGEPKKRLSRSAAQKLVAHRFPGNVRELEHVLVHASVFASGRVIEAEDLSLETDVYPGLAAGEPSSFDDYKNAERERILDALNAHGWNRAQAARSLGIPRRTFYRRLKQHGIALPDGGT